VVPIAGDLAAALTEHDAGWAVETTTSANARGAGTRPQAARSRHSALHAPAVDLESLYLRAEGAMRDHALTEARAALETIATSDPGGRLGEAALLDLARLALAEGDREAARRALARLPSPLHDAALVETAEHLRCRAASTHPAADRDGDDPCPIRTPGRAR
jgi:thioredoxin-like negative regulator of GroEL